MTLRRTMIALGAALAMGSDNVFTADDSVDGPNTWRAYAEGIPALGERFVSRIHDPKDPQLRQEFYRFLYQNLSWGFFTRMYQDPSYPDFWPMFNQAWPIGFANPDDSYYQAVIDDKGTYRISGHRGTTYMVDFQIGSGKLSSWGEETLGPTKRNLDLDRDVHVKQDGTFEVILSPTRPRDWTGDWWPLDPGATFIWVRQIAYDWEKEVDGRFAIERLDVPAAKPRDSAAELARRMRLMSEFVANWTDFELKWIEQWLGNPPPINSVKVLDFSRGGGITTQRYIQGVFELQPDEALILDTEVPKDCRYWMFQLTDELTNTLDWTNRQSTINGHYARLDADGRFRAVISAKDPGVPNWLDVVDYRRGLIVGRWKECGSYPQPGVTKVNIADVRKHLPPDTPVVTPQQRDQQIRRKREAVQLRRRW